MAAGQRWTRDELLVAFRLYCQTPFGRLHNSNPDIIKLSELIGRTPSALAMKACNFASFDPTHQARKVKGLKNAAKSDGVLWDEFITDSDRIALEADAAFARLTASGDLKTVEELVLPTGLSEIERVVSQRRLQAFFRSAVLASYEYQCALTGISLPALLNASHIIPWSENEAHRADPRNGIALNTLHDRAFDRGLITFDRSLRMVVSNQLKVKRPTRFHRQSLLDLEGSTLCLPHRFAPDPEALDYHRNRIFHDN